MTALVALLVAYVLGSIPAAYIAGKTRGIDLREHGSGNLGGTNVARVLGWKMGAVVMLFDALKGALPVAVFPRLLSPVHTELWAIAIGVAAIVGHVRPIFMLGRGGGKGVATAAGVFIALAPGPMAVTLAVWTTLVLVSGYVSLGSLAAAIVLPAVLLWTRGDHSPVFVASVVIAAFVFWTHRANIGRLRRGQEHRFGRGKGREHEGAASVAPDGLPDRRRE